VHTGTGATSGLIRGLRWVCKKSEPQCLGLCEIIVADSYRAWGYPWTPLAFGVAAAAIAVNLRLVRPVRSSFGRYHPARDTVFQILAPASRLVENGGRMNVRNLFAELKQRNVYKVRFPTRSSPGSQRNLEEKLTG
jgi:hypothetical protein